jgi:ankyrin repeat protein
MRPQILVAAGAESDRLNKHLYTPLAYAIMYKHTNVAELLFHSGAKLKNVHPTVKIPDWMTGIIAKRQLIMSFTLALKGVLKRRLGLSKDVTHLISIYFWNARLK